ncbi:DNA (cytosine-5)-methyltransferase 3 [Sphaceloma murrayae]|uniref:DNA (Cytosine-5)-methyltransferase 3 n=1 Tax=Sphaceloma murrayae TaxID=2082308 RepID=A0A2K1QMW4_9PEZI|nr:DNA (cytosine-5)-methyltransferase 3 [Sphaceloma murrayae]
MLPPQLRAGPATSLRRVSVSSIRTASLAARLPAASDPPHSVQKRSYFWRSRHCWDSHLDPTYHEYQRKRHQRVRAALRDALRRRTKWQMPLPFSKILGTRAASHWSRSNLRKWPQLEEELRRKGKNEQDYELSPGEKRWRKQMQAMKDYVNANPYRAVFGKPFEPFWSPSMWGLSTPSWVKEDSSAGLREHDTKIDQQSEDHSEARESTRQDHVLKASGGATRAPPQNPNRYVESSSFSYTSTKQPGQPNVIKASSTTWDSASNETTHSHYDPVSGRMIAAPSSGSSVGTPAAPPTSAPDPTLAKTATAGIVDPNVVKPSAAVETPSRKVTAGVAAATRFTLRKIGSSTESKLSVLPNHDVDFLTADTIRASMGKIRQVGSTSTQTSKPDRATLNNDFDARFKEITAQIEDARTQLAEAKAKSSLQNLKTRGRTTLQPALDRVNARSDTQKSRIKDALAVLDGHTSTSTTVEPQQQDDPADDGYSRDPIGLQLTYENETKAVAKKDRPDLAREIEDKTMESAPQDDGYTQEPVGLQTTYAVEREGVRKNERAALADEILGTHSEDEQHSDGYTEKPIGLQSSYAEEREAVAKQARPDIAQEIISKPLEDSDAPDGYTKQPIGLQTTYANERKAVAKGDRPALEDEMERNAKIAVEAQLGLAGQYVDGYTNKPVGLETSYQKEREACDKGRRASLEDELKMMNGQHKARGQNAKLPPSLGFLNPRDSTSKRLDSVDTHKIQQQAAAREMLDSEITAQKHAMKMYEARHAHSSKSDSEKPGSAITKGEGDMDLNVTKFAHRNNWYKQNNSLRMSSRVDDDLVASIVKICRENGLSQHGDYAKFQQELKDKVESLESRVAEQDKKLQETRLLGTRRELSKEKQALVGKSEQATQTVTTPLQTASSFSAEWADPPSYKILAYDLNKTWSADSMQIVTTTARFSDNEVPISVPQALSSVTEPARFVTHFSNLQKEGYQAIHASGNLLVLRRVKMAPRGGIEVPAQPEKALTGDKMVNPVDGTARHTPIETATGNYASPTGFVNHDPVFPVEKPADAGPSIGAAETSAGEDGVYYRHFPRVRRQEAVFSGWGRYRDEEHHRNRGQKSRARRAAWKRRVKFAFSVGLTSAALVYALGVGAELAKGEKQRRNEVVGV